MLALTASAPAAWAGHCERLESMPSVQAALSRIERTIDPCGESAELAGLVRRFRHCAATGVRVCLDHEAERNVTEYGAARATTITWNPALRSPLEQRCADDPARPVVREPTASLLHELVHAVQACDGLDPAAHELEAVRLENVYRRAGGLCQRTRYGDMELPPDMLRACAPGRCSCQRGVDLVQHAGTGPHASLVPRHAGAAGDLNARPNAHR